MPELPEVETIKREFARELIGRSIRSVDVRSADIIDVPTEQFVERVRGAEFTGVNRRAKYLAVNLSSGFTLIFHLKISGQLLYVSADEPVDKHTLVIFTLDDGKQLRLRNINSFASINLLSTPDVPAFFAHHKLGPEPLTPKFTYEVFRTNIRRHRRAHIKTVLTDQHVIAGIGSIYADEILFYARVHPARKVGELSDDELYKIYEGIRKILPEAIEHRGTTTNYYLDLNGRKGEHQNYLKVHAKAGEPCEGCPGVVEMIALSGKGTYLCPSCQH